MANWCQNNLTITGKTENIRSLLLNALPEVLKQETPTSNIRLHPLCSYYMFECYDVTNNENFILNKEYISNFNSESLELSYETRWTPNVTDIINLCRRYRLDCELYYEELGCLIYGYTKYTCSTDEEIVVDLDDSEIQLYTDNSGETCYDSLDSALQIKIIQSCPNKSYLYS